MALGSDVSSSLKSILGQLPSALDQERKQQGKLDAATDKTVEAYERSADERKNINAEYADVLKPPQLEKFTPPEPANPLQGWGAAAMAIASLGSLFTRSKAVTALNSASGVLNAFREQNLDSVNSAFAKWKVDNDNALKTHQYELDAYNAAIKNADADPATAEAELKALSASFKNSSLSMILDQGLPSAISYINQQQSQHERAEKMGAELNDRMSKFQLVAKLGLARKAEKEAAASGDPAKIQAAQQQLQQVAQDVKDWQSVNSPSAEARVEGGPQQQFLNKKRDEAEAAGKPWTAEDEEAAAAEWAKTTAKPGAARSAASMAVQKYMQEHPEATSADIQKFAAQGVARSAAQRSLEAGPMGNQLQALSVATDHLYTLKALNDAFSGGDERTIAAAKSAWEKEFGTPAPANMDLAAQFVAPELIKAIEGTPGGVVERDKMTQAFEAARGESNVGGAIDTAFSLMGGQLNGLRHRVVNVDKLVNDDEFDDMVTGPALDAMKKHKTAAPESGGVRHKVGDMINQGGKTYRATKVDADGKVLEADEVQ